MVGGLGSGKSSSSSSGKHKFAGPSLSGELGGGPGHAPLTRPSSVGDFNEVEEDGWNNITQMSERQVLAEFEKMLENMNLSEVKQKPLRDLPLSKKRDMLSMHVRTQARVRFHSPADYIQYLSSNADGHSLQKKYSCIESLRVALTSNSLQWVQDFTTGGGLKQVLNLLNECFRK